MSLRISLFTVIALFSGASFADGYAYRQACVKTFLDAQYSPPSEGFGQLCYPIRTDGALSCIRALVRNRYSNITTDVTSGCGYVYGATGAHGVDAMLDNHYSNITGDLLEAAGGSVTWPQANCVAAIFNNHYSNVTPAFIRSSCY